MRTICLCNSKQDASGFQTPSKHTLAAVLRPGGVAANATVRRDATQGAPYFNYVAADGKTHQVGWQVAAGAQHVITMHPLAECMFGPLAR